MKFTVIFVLTIVSVQGITRKEEPTLKSNEKVVDLTNQNEKDLNNPQNKICFELNKACGGFDLLSVPSDCCSGHYCDKHYNVCLAKKVLKEECESPEQCLSERCEVELDKGMICKETMKNCNKPGTSPCTASSQVCCGGTKCQSNKCLVCQSDNDPCSTNDDCCSNNCFYDDGGNKAVCRPKEIICLPSEANCKPDLSTGSPAAKPCCKGICFENSICKEGKPKDDTCSEDKECISGFCGWSSKGLRRCFARKLQQIIKMEVEDSPCQILENHLPICSSVFQCIDKKCKQCATDGTVCSSHSQCCRGTCSVQGKATVCGPIVNSIANEECFEFDEVNRKLCGPGLTCYNKVCKPTCELDGDDCKEDGKCCSGKCVMKLGKGKEASETKCGFESDEQREFGLCMYLSGGTEPKCQDNLKCVETNGKKKCLNCLPNSSDFKCNIGTDCCSGNCFWNSEGLELMCQEPQITSIPNGGSCEFTNHPIKRKCKSGNCCNDVCSDKKENGKPCSKPEECCSAKCDINEDGQIVCLDPRKDICISDDKRSCEHKADSNGNLGPKCCGDLNCRNFKCSNCKKLGFEGCYKHEDCCSGNCFWKEDGSILECAPPERTTLTVGAICPMDSKDVCGTELKCFNGKCLKCNNKNDEGCQNDSECCSTKCVFNSKGEKVCGYADSLVSTFNAPCSGTIDKPPQCDSHLGLFCVNKHCIKCTKIGKCTEDKDCCTQTCRFDSDGRSKSCKQPNDQICIDKQGECDYSAPVDKTFESDPKKFRICCQGTCHGFETKRCVDLCLEENEPAEGKVCCSGFTGYSNTKTKICVGIEKYFQNEGEVCDVEGPGIPKCGKDLGCVGGKCKPCMEVGTVKNCLSNDDCCSLVCNIDSGSCLPKSTQPADIDTTKPKYVSPNSINCLKAEECSGNNLNRCCDGTACSQDGTCTKCSKVTENCKDSPCCSNLHCSEKEVCEPMKCPNNNVACKSISDCCVGLICGSTGTCDNEPGKPCKSVDAPCTGPNECCSGLSCKILSGNSGICKKDMKLIAMARKKKILFAAAMRKKLAFSLKPKESPNSIVSPKIPNKIFFAMNKTESEPNNVQPKEEENEQSSNKEKSDKSITTEINQQTNIEINQNPFEVELIKKAVESVQKRTKADSNSGTLLENSIDLPKCLPRQSKCKINLPTEEELLSQLDVFLKRYQEYEKSGKNPIGIPPDKITMTKAEIEAKDYLNVLVADPNAPITPMTNVDIGIFGIKVPFTISNVLKLISSKNLKNYEIEFSKYIDVKSQNPSKPTAESLESDLSASNEAENKEVVKSEDELKNEEINEILANPCCNEDKCVRIKESNYAVCMQGKCLEKGTPCSNSKNPCCFGTFCIWDRLGRKKSCMTQESNMHMCIDFHGKCDKNDKHCCPGLKCFNGECEQNCNFDGKECLVNGEDRCCENSPCDPETGTCRIKRCTEDGQDCKFLQCCPGYICNRDRICRYAPPPSSPLRIDDAMDEDYERRKKEGKGQEWIKK